MPPRLISHYKLVRRLGVGGMGEVYLAQDTRRERPVALKVMSAELARDPNQRRRFQTEARAASVLSHPHICTIHEVGETPDGRPFLAMEYVEGQPLNVVLQRRRLTIREVIQIGIDAAEALAAAHAQGLVHRDIKPGNLMLDRQGRVKVLDFGLAKWFVADELSPTATSIAHTRTGMVIGTPQYMSPEQAMGRTLDPRTDLFSLGAVLYESVAGQRPFLGRTAVETINNIVDQPPASLGLEDPALSPGLNSIIFKCLAKEPANRYESAEDLTTELRRLKEDSDRTLTASPHDQAGTAAGGPAGPAGGRTPLWITATNDSLPRKTALRWATGFAVVGLALSAWVLFRGCGSRTVPPGTNPAVLPQPR